MAGALDRRALRPRPDRTAAGIGGDTLFHFRQAGELVVATYEGGKVLHGQLIGLSGDVGVIAGSYQHATHAGVIESGRCNGRLEIQPDGRAVLALALQPNGAAETAGSLALEELPRDIDEPWDI